MNKEIFNRIVLTVALITTACISSSAWAQGKGGGKGNGGGGSGGGSSAEYTFVTLDDRAGYVRSWIGDLGKIGTDWFCVGNLDEASGDQAVVWQVSPDGSNYTVTTHYLADGEFATGINSLGECVGYGSTVDPIEQVSVRVGYYWSSHSANPLALPPLTGDNETAAHGINAAGIIVGRSTYRYFAGSEVVNEDTAVAWRAFVVQSGLEIRGPFVLGVQPGPYSARDALAVNDCDQAGIAQAVGATELGPTDWQLQCLANGDVAVLSGPNPLVAPDDQGWGTANAINNNGDSCGTSIPHRAFRRLADGTTELLSTKPRSAISRGHDINDNRQVVGLVEDHNKSIQYGALWEADGARVDLNKKLGSHTDWQHINFALAIDSEGNIAGSGRLIEVGESRALLMIKN